jgi:hypothetical protein
MYQLCLDQSEIALKVGRAQDLYGRGQPLQFTLSFDEIPWFDDRGEIQRCDWFKITHSLETLTGHIQKNAFSDQSQRPISPRSSNLAKRQYGRGQPLSFTLSFTLSSADIL